MEILRRKPYPKPSAYPFLFLAALLSLLIALFVWWRLSLPQQMIASSRTAVAAKTPAPYSGPVFTNVTVQAGLNVPQASREKMENCADSNGGGAYGKDGFGESCMAKVMSGGAAAADFDNNGTIDLFLTRVYGHASLYSNKGDGTFEDVTAASGITTPENTNGAIWADVDNDGDKDLYVTTIDQPRFLLFINDGRGRFTEQAVQRGAEVPAVEAEDQIRQGFSVAAGDYDNDGYVDLFTGQWGKNMFTSYSRLLHNLGAKKPGYFEDATVSAGFSPTNNPLMKDDNVPDRALASSFFMDRYSGKYAFAPAFADLDGDGWQDLAIAADFGSSRLFWNNHDGTFTDGTAAAHVGSDENGMGSTIGDINDDGLPDWFVTAIYQKMKQRGPCASRLCMEGISGDRLYVNQGNRMFRDDTDAAGVRDGGWGWGAAMFDYDNDGRLDLVMTNGMTEDPFQKDTMRLWRGENAGAMTDVSKEAGIIDNGSGKGLIVFDYDNDGDLDVLAVNNSAAPVLYRNDGGNSNDWIAVRAHGTRSNRDALGARVTVTSGDGKAQTREIGSVTHFLGQSENDAHFGLAKGSGPVSVRIHWPASGCDQSFNGVERNSTFEVTEPADCSQTPAN